MRIRNVLRKLHSVLGTGMAALKRRLFGNRTSIQMSIAVSFTIVSLCSLCFLGFMLYQQFETQEAKLTVENSEQLLEQTALSLEDYLRSMRRISDAIYYSVIKDTDLSVDTIEDEINLLYEANKEKVVSIACYTNEGELVAATPIVTSKQNVDVTTQDWFVAAMEQLENFHFSVPHVQNLFDDSTYRYDWVISLSRTVELIDNGSPILGVLLVDMNYSSIEQLFDKINTDVSSEYFYLMDQNGSIIYHPKQDLISSGLYEENNLEAITYDSDSRTEIFNGKRRIITQRTISYTGWKLVSVVPESSFLIGQDSSKYLLLMLVALALLVMLIVNQLVSKQITMPLRKLTESVQAWEIMQNARSLNAAEKLYRDYGRRVDALAAQIYVGGTSEVEHLGRTLRATVMQLQQLMDDIVVEQEEKRKSELDALQSQINPHFLYNTLDSIVWMITGERYDDAVFMITQLASLFRISLSQGNTVIRIEDEIRHAQNYMNIQKVRYKNSFRVEFDIDESILSCSTVKLVVQPLLENAIYYGMEFMDGEGLITVRGYRKDAGVYLEVQDNGLGMPQEAAARLLTESNRPRSRGSGVGLLNVHNRIRLCFGEAYGLEIETQPDEGMTVRIHLPDGD